MFILLSLYRLSIVSSSTELSILSTIALIIGGILGYPNLPYTGGSSPPIISPEGRSSLNYGVKY